MIERANIGLDLAVIGSAVSIAGVLVNNVFLMHVLAMWIWVPSNALFVLYFYGRSRDWWDGGLSDKMLCINYIVMLLSGVWGLMQ
jgi:hypothetical protein